MVEALPSGGILRIVRPDDVSRLEQAKNAEKASAGITPQTETALAGFIRTKWDVFKRHRDNNMSGWSDRLVAAMRAFNGSYSPEKLAEIKKFGGSEVYARLIAMKCRGASSLLRDVYLGADRPWGLDPASDPDLPPEVLSAVQQLVQVELATLQQAGTPPDPVMIRDRVAGLMNAARDAGKKRAAMQANLSEDKIEEILVRGGFYKALSEFIVDLPLFPFACIKGPVVRIVPSVKWVQGKAVTQNTPTLFWNRVSPFDLYWTPGVSDIEDAEMIERSRLTRADLNDLLDLPGYDADAIKAVLNEYGSGGLNDAWDTTDAERAVQENRENPHFNQSGLITCLEYHGNVQGQQLLEQGFTKSEVPVPERDYFVQAWLIGTHVIKTQLSPSPRKRHPYYLTSFEKVPGTPVGNGLPDILDDMQDSANATLRSLINNLSISSGPQVVVNDDRLAADEDGEQMFPWKRWHVTSDPMGNGNGAEKPIEFFQPASNAQELLGVYQKFSDMADELSAIPKFLTGNGPGGGAGRTSSGLAMLMGNASKILQTVAANIDRDVLDPALGGLFDMIMLTDTTGMLTGQEQVRVRGVQVAIQKETQRARQLEFLQTTANPIDSQIMGPKGRAAVLRAVSQTIGLEGTQIVPSDDEIEKQQQQAQAAMVQQKGLENTDPAAAAQGSQAPMGGNVTGDVGPRVNIAGGAH